MTRDHHADDPTTGRPAPEPGAGPTDDAPDVRAMLHRQADTVRPRGTYDDVERRVAASAGSARPWVRPALVAAAAVAALVLGAATVATISDRNDDEVVDTAGDPGTTAPPSPTVVQPDRGGTATTVVGTSPESTTTTTAPPTSTTRPPSTTTSTPTPTVEPITEATRVTLRGIGPVAVPAELADVSARIGVDLHRDESSVLDPTATCGFVSKVAGLDGLFFMLDGTRVVRVDVDAGSPIRTVSGIGNGSTEAEVEAAYPGRVEVTPHPYTGPTGHYLTVTDPSAPGYSIIFETDGTTVTSYRSGLAEYVSYIEGCA